MPGKSNSLDSVVRAYYRDWWKLSPTAGSRAGLHEFDAELESPSREYFDERVRQVSRAETALRDVPVPADATIDALDRKTFDAHLAVTRLRLEGIQHWRQDPSQPLTEAVDSLFELMMRRDVSQLDTVRSIASRLSRLPDFLRSSRSRIDDPVALWVTVAEQTVRGAIEFLRSAVIPLGQSHASLGGVFESAGRDAIEAIQQYGSWLASLREESLNEDVAIGSEAMTHLVRQWHGLAGSLEDIEALGWNLVQSYRDELEQYAARTAPGVTWQQILERARSEFVRKDRDMLAAYRDITQDLRERMTRGQLLDLPPGEVCKVVPTPAFLRALLPTAAYTNPGPLDPSQIGVFFVTQPDRSNGEEAYRANVAQHYGIEETCVHEAYPGHHVQLCWANRAGSLARQMADHIIFMEGWTLYCEQWMIDGGWFSDPVLTINYLLGQLWRSYRIVIDVGLHTRKMTVPTAVQMLIDGVGFTRERAETELNWYSQSPAVPLSYMLGKRETLELRDAFLKRPGETPRGFHRWLLQFGSVPQRWLWSHLPKSGE